MSTIATPLPETPQAWKLPYRGKVGMACLIIAESAIFTIFVVAYLFYIGKSLSGPTPREVLETPDLLHDLSAIQQPDDSLCGKTSGTRQARRIPALWFLTIVLGGLFLLWHWRRNGTG